MTIQSALGEGMSYKASDNARDPPVCHGRRMLLTPSGKRARVLFNILQNTEDLLTGDSYLASMTAVARLKNPARDQHYGEREKEGEGQRSENELTPLILATALEKNNHLSLVYRGQLSSATQRVNK